MLPLILHFLNKSFCLYESMELIMLLLVVRQQRSMTRPTLPHLLGLQHQCMTQALHSDPCLETPNGPQYTV